MVTVHQQDGSGASGESSSMLDFMSMKSYPDMSLEMSMLNNLGESCFLHIFSGLCLSPNSSAWSVCVPICLPCCGLGKTVKKEPEHDEGHQHFDDTAKLLQEFQDTQVDRVGSRPSSNLSSLSNASERDQHHLGKRVFYLEWWSRRISCQSPWLVTRLTAHVYCSAPLGVSFIATYFSNFYTFSHINRLKCNIWKEKKSSFCAQNFRYVIFYFTAYIMSLVLQWWLRQFMNQIVFVDKNPSSYCFVQGAQHTLVWEISQKWCTTLMSFFSLLSQAPLPTADGCAHPPPPTEGPLVHWLFLLCIYSKWIGPTYCSVHWLCCVM